MSAVCIYASSSGLSVCAFILVRWCILFFVYVAILLYIVSICCDTCPLGGLCCVLLYVFSCAPRLWVLLLLVAEVIFGLIL